MTANTKPIAKSLHTVTVIVQIARLELCAGQDLPLDRNSACNEAVTRALCHLGLNSRPDPYGLANVALKQLIGA